LDHAAREDAVRAVTGTPADVERLWEVCQIPDYRKIAPANHAELVVTVYGFLMREGKIETDWFARQIEQADRTDGDIDTLSTRIAHIRTWTFAANRPDWLADPEHWQGVTRAVEDKLSDALHERLTERFVDRRTSVLMRRLRENATLEPQINKTGEVIVEGHVIGRLDGFVFLPDASSGGSDTKALQNAAQKALAGEIDSRATRIAEAPDGQLVLAADGTIRWTGSAVGKLVAGEDALHPRVRLIADEHLTGAPRDAVQARMDQWLKTHIERLLAPLFELSAATDVTGIARGVAFQLVEALGVLDRPKVAEDVKGLQQPDRATLRKYGVRFGAYHIYIPALLKPAPRALAVQLWELSHGGDETKNLVDLLHLAGSGRTSIPVNKEIDPNLYRTAGYRACGERAVRVDILERLADLIRPALSWREGAPGQKPAAAFPGGGFTVVNGMTSLIGASGEDFASVLRSLGYRMERRPKPPEPAPAPQPIEAALPAGEPVPELTVTEAAQAEGAGLEAVAPEQAAQSEIPPDEQISEPVAGHVETSVDAAEAEAAPPEPGIGAQATDSETVPEAEAAAAAVAAPSETETAPQSVDATTSPAATEAAQPAEEPALVEVWRPGRPEGRRRPRERRREHGKPGRTETPRHTSDEAPAVAAAGEAALSGEQPAAEAPGRSGRPHRHRHRGGERQGERHGERRERPDRPPRDRERPQQQRPARFERREREKAPDPNSPFAKLAGLKAQLEAEAKERR